MRTLVHTFPDGRQFLDSYANDGRRERLFLRGVTDVTAGEPLDLEICFADSGYRFRSLAEVLLRRLQDGKRIPAGTLVLLVGKPSRARMVAHARGQAITYANRRDPRLRCAFPVEVFHRRQRALALAVDYAPGGLQLAGGLELNVADAVKLRLYPAGAVLGITIWGQVMWIQRHPELAFGINLRPKSGMIRRRLNRLYEQLLARHLG